MPNTDVAIMFHNGHAYASGLRACGNIWTCPTCSARIRARRLQEIDTALTNHTMAGGQLGLMTLTLRHDRRMKLSDSLSRLNDAWATIQSRRQYQPLYNATTGTIATLEITYGENGWHPHLHIILLAGVDKTYWDLQAATEKLRPLWSRLANTKSDRFTLRHGLDLTWFGKDSATIAKYVTKIAKEITLTDTKSGVDPFTLLDTDNAINAARYIEYALATKGRQCHRWSNGLRRALLPECPIDQCTRTDEHQHDDSDLALNDETLGTEALILSSEYWNSISDLERLAWIELVEAQHLFSSA
jgi:hypothetical protein